MKREGLDWLVAADNNDYIAPEFLHVLPEEAEALKQAASRSLDLLREAARKVVRENRLSEMGIPANAHKLVAYSVQNELDDCLIGRFDFAGGLDGLPIRLLEFNADTCSLLPETAIVQEYMSRQTRPTRQPFNDLLPALERRFGRLLNRHHRQLPSLLFSTMGHDEDWLNVETLARAAHVSGFTDVHQVLLEKVIFSPGEGVFLELNRNQFLRFGFWYKHLPWDFIATEEPDLMDMLTRMVMAGELTALNPACAMLLQCKALLAVASELAPREPLLLRTSLRGSDFPDGRYVRKPIFGRMGENIALYDGAGSPKAQTAGDYANQPVVYQELAAFNIDSDGCRYQPSIFVTDEPCALAIRRQDALIIGDDAEYIPHWIN